MSSKHLIATLLPEPERPVTMTICVSLISIFPRHIKPGQPHLSMTRVLSRQLTATCPYFFPSPKGRKNIARVGAASLDWDIADPFTAIGRRELQLAPVLGHGAARDLDIFRG